MMKMTGLRLFWCQLLLCQLLGSSSAAAAAAADDDDDDDWCCVHSSTPRCCRQRRSSPLPRASVSPTTEILRPSSCTSYRYVRGHEGSSCCRGRCLMGSQGVVGGLCIMDLPALPRPVSQLTLGCLYSSLYGRALETLWFDKGCHTKRLAS